MHLFGECARVGARPFDTEDRPAGRVKVSFLQAGVHYWKGQAPPGRSPIYTLPVIVFSFAVVIILAIWIEMPLWMVGLAGILALLGYLLERKRPS